MAWRALTDAQWERIRPHLAREKRRPRVAGRARYLRVTLLELERLYDHAADFGIIASDSCFAVAHSRCFRSSRGCSDSTSG